MYVCVYVCMYVCMYVCVCVYVVHVGQNRKLSRHRRSPDNGGEELNVIHKRVATDGARTYNSLYDREEN